MVELPSVEETFARQPLTLTNYKVDIDTPPGAMIRISPDGMAIYMRFDAPGIYLNDHGKRVPDVIARRAGYDTEYYGKLRQRDEARRKVLGEIDKQFQATTSRRTIVEQDDYRVVEISRDFYNIEFKDNGDEPGFVLNAHGPVDRETAMQLFRELTGTEEAAEAATSQPVDADVAKGASKKV